MSLKIKSFKAKNGERFSQLYSSAEPWPLFYPTAFIVRCIRLRTTHDTQKVYLEAIKRLCEWEAAKKIDLQVRFQRHEFLRPHEIDELARYLNAARRGKAGEAISASKGNTYVAYAGQYLHWLADEVITDTNSPEVRLMIETQHSRLKDKLIPKTGSKSAKSQNTLEKRLPEKTREQLRALWGDPFVDIFRLADRGSRLRTVVMLRILYETGMRRGELLSLKLKNLLESTGGAGARLVIEKNHGDEYDTRINQPVAKTRGRTVPITAALEEQLIEYIAEYRADVPNVGFDDEDFIFVTHRGVRGQGKPLSISNFDQAVAGLKKLFPALGTLHPHLLRHDWNYRFSKKVKELETEENLSTTRARELREILMGWTEESEMSRRYNLRQLQEESWGIGLQVAGDTVRRPQASVENQAEAQKLALVVANSK
jgi:integrase